MGAPIPWPVKQRAERLVLELRELLVRMDENEKAWRLLDGCVPFFLEDGTFANLERARAEQRAMVAHLLDPEAYEAYYAANVHERPFEDQYGLDPADAHQHLSRVAFLRERLERSATLIDLACNDGWLVENLDSAGLRPHYYGVDLNPRCIDRARGRAQLLVGGTKAEFADGDAMTYGFEAAPELASGASAVVAFEVVEHVPDPDALLTRMVALARPGGSVYLSTPDGVDHGGDLPRWWHVEPKGHVRVYTLQSFVELLGRHGANDENCEVLTGPDGVLFAHLRTDSRPHDAGQLRAHRADHRGAEDAPADEPGG